MDSFERSKPAGRHFAITSEDVPEAVPRRHRREPVRTPGAYRICDAGTEALVYFMVIFTPWAFGTTQEWSIWTMNITAYALGLLLAAKWGIRWRMDFKPRRWGEEESADLLKAPASRGMRFTRGLTIALAVLTVLVLGYILVSALNKRADYLIGQRRFEYYDAIKWLPQSYDGASTWQSFWMYLGLACFFWSLRDWLLGKETSRRRKMRKRNEGGSEEPQGAEAGELVGLTEGAPVAFKEPDGGSKMPPRLRRLLWLLSINGGVLALEGILQRLSGTSKLLWLLEPIRNNFADAQFGPYSYRSNAAQYFNLLWPVCLGFWLWLRHDAARFRHRNRFGGQSHVVLLPLAVLMAACPVISTSRGGALVGIVLTLGAVAITLWHFRGESRLAKIGVILLFGTIIGLGGYLGWEKLGPRFRAVFEDRLSNRIEIYRNARTIAAEYPVWGIGAGAFGAVYQLYRENPQQNWAAYLHDDWLETRITLGWVGFAMVCFMLAMVAARWWGEGGISLPHPVLMLSWLAVMGCMVHARFDFPLQVYSVLFLVLLICAIVFVSKPQQAK